MVVRNVGAVVAKWFHVVLFQDAECTALQLKKRPDRSFTVIAISRIGPVEPKALSFGMRGQKLVVLWWASIMVMLLKSFLETDRAFWIK